VEYYPGFYPGAGNYGEARTDTNGRYEIIGEKGMNIYDGEVIESNSVLARDAEGNLAVVQDVYMTITNVDLVLQPAITLSGSVKDTEGVPMLGAEVGLRFWFGMSHVLEARPIKVNELGQFSWSALPQGREYEVFVVTAKGYGFDGADVYPKDTRTNRHQFPTFVLKRADRIIAGCVLDDAGKPLAGAEVYFSGKGQPMNSKDKWGQQPFCNTKTDNEGKFSFDAVCAGPLRVCADPHDNGRHNGGGMEYRDVHGGDTNIVIRL
jgi:protocatechuate 3,4-dioxygenase beta subunit